MDPRPAGDPWARRTGVTRRTALRGLSLATMAVGAGSLLAACGADSGVGHAAPRAGVPSPPPAPPPPAPVPTGTPTTVVDRPGIRLVSSDVKRRAGDAAALPAAVAGLHHLGAGLYAELAGTPGNLAISPFSIGVALALTVNGARGRTASEMLGVLGAKDTAALDSGLNALTAHVDGLSRTVREPSYAHAHPQRVEVASTNALFGQQDRTWQPVFLDVLAADFGAGMHTVDWEHATEAARLAVNAWTAARTNDRITDILPAGSVDELTQLVLVNALYLKAPWDQPFERATTVPRPFHLADSTTVTVPTMASDSWFAYSAGDGYAAATLPFLRGTLGMTLVLPDEGRLADLEQAVAAGGLPGMLEPGERMQLELRVPRWSFRTQVSLGRQLATLGMPTALDDVPGVDADFSGMTTDVLLYIDDVLHQVYIDVDEDGTEAAAATAVIMGIPTSLEVAPPPIQMYLDRPFLFVIHDTAHRTPLFVGRVVDPRG